MDEKFSKSKIQIFLQDDNDILAKYYGPNDEHLSGDLVDYITERIYETKIRAIIEIHINIEHYNNSNDTPDIFKRALKNTFEKKIISIDKKIKINKLLALISLLIGIFLGIGVYLFSMINEPVGNLISIACWVFIWYAVETDFFTNRELKVRRTRYNQILGAKITI